MNKIVIVPIALVAFLFVFMAWGLTVASNADASYDKMNCEQLRSAINFALDHKYDLSVITDNTYANKRLAANCLH